MDDMCAEELMPFNSGVAPHSLSQPEPSGQ